MATDMTLDQLDAPPRKLAARNAANLEALWTLADTARTRKATGITRYGRYRHTRLRGRGRALLP